MLLSEVALGKMLELKKGKYINELKFGFHSVKGVGRLLSPDPSSVHITDDGVTIPLGKPIPSEHTITDLKYDEVVVYNVAQVNIKYLLRVKFIYQQ